MNTNLTHTIDPSKEPLLRSLLESAAYSFAPADHAFWRARDGRTTITFYRSGKLLIQGESPEAAATLLADAGLLTQTSNPLPKQPSEPPAPQLTPTIDPAFPTWIGTDESGKGDYFGPLAVAGVLVTKETALELTRLGVRDSKQLSDTAIRTLAPAIKIICPHSVATITPREYNGLYPRMRNLNRLLAWGHARVIEVILSNHPCSHAITDQFGDERYLNDALLEKGRQITLIQRAHAESDPAVASASILARESFLKGLETLSLKYQIELPKGASQSVIEAGREFVSRHGKGKLKEVAKLHFATTQQLLG
jgi:ribonuclease HIII